MATEPKGYSVEVVRSRKARRISLRVLAEGRVRLTIPWWQPKGPALRWAEERHEWIVAAIERQRSRAKRSQTLSDDEVEALRKVAKERLPKALNEASQRTGIGYNKLTIRKARTRWGSCTREGNISLSLYLAALPDELVELVCVHELCHRIHPNHSADFHALVDRHLGGREKELNAQLRRYRPGQKGQ